MEQSKFKIICLAIVCLTVLELYAISQGINGTLMRWVFIIIAGLAGFVIPSPQQWRIE